MNSLLALALVGAVAGEPSIPHERYTLANGLEVVLAPDRSTPIVHTHLWYHVGSKDEEQGRTGFAHLFEHLMFQGSANSPGEYFTPIQEVGGAINGTTNVDRTNYFETVPSQFLPLALFMESDRMGNLLPALTQEKLDNQREVVRNERRQRYENRPYGESWVYLSEALYPEGHPYFHSTIGSHEDLEAATLDDVSRFFKTWYVPNNATLVVVGDFETAQAKELIEQNFGWIPRGEDPKHLTAAPVSLKEKVVVVKEQDVPDAKLWMAWHSPPFFEDGDAELDIASSLLCTGKDSRMHKVIVEEKGLARDINCGQVSRKLTSFFMVTGTAADGHTTEEVAQAVREVIIDTAKNKAPKASEIAAAVTNFEVNFYQRLQTIYGKGGLLNNYLFFKDDSNFIGSDLGRYLRLSPTAVQGAMQTFLLQPHVELHIRPPAGEAE